MLFTQQFESALQELPTLQDLLRFGMSQFKQAKLHFGHGADNAWDEALHLALHALYLEPDDVDKSILESRLTLDERKSILTLFHQRIEQRIPAAYLTGTAWFAGLKFEVDKRVLIPRSPIGELIEEHFEPWIEYEEVSEILDLCSGSGCIAIACAEYFPEANVDAVELSTDALDVLRSNVQKHQMSEQVTLIHSDLFQAVPQKQYDIIVSNPPYVDANEMNKLPPEYRYEPEMGLASGVDGLDIVVKILRQAKDYLTKHGILVLEVGLSAIALEKRYPEVPFTWLEFERGGEGVLLLTAKELNRYSF